MGFDINEYLQKLQGEKKKELPEEFLEEIDKHDLMIVCDTLSSSFVVEIDKRIRANKLSCEGVMIDLVRRIRRSTRA